MKEERQNASGDERLIWLGQPRTKHWCRDQDEPNNSGNVIYTFGSGQLLKQINWSSTDIDQRVPLSIKVPTFAGDNLEEGASEAGVGKFMNDDCQYMFDFSYLRTLILGDLIHEGGKRICRRLASLRQEEECDLPQQLDEAQGEDLPVPKHDGEPVHIMGSIVVYPEKKHDRVPIVDFDDLTLYCMKLDFSKMKAWSVFPGETVVLKKGQSSWKSLPSSKSSHEINLELLKAPMELGKKLSMVIASGPYTAKDDLFNPLFNTIAETYDEYFEKLIINIMSSVSTNTEVLIVSHHDDLMSMFVYPSFPYHLYSETFPNQRFLSDSCIVSINGLEIGITTADIIKDLSEDEESGGQKGDKIKHATVNDKDFSWKKEINPTEGTLGTHGNNIRDIRYVAHPIILMQLETRRSTAIQFMDIRVSLIKPRNDH
ncbi:DNA polymerase alpha subunit B-like [Aedes aegypti]|uniref:DNA polymerase alpha subunit B n=1 Tax=Aedes aegypti TaxID=7159 RepID=A0A6I8TYK2_AEDAE|nr:DNA polymerase alpha subunit B-like [Aedes aegypti]